MCNSAGFRGPEPTHNPKVAGSNPAPATIDGEGFADAAPANPFRLPRLHSGIAKRWRPDSCGNSERLFRSPLPMPCRDGQQSWTCVIPVSERSFADRSGLVEIHVTRATSGEDLRRQLDGVRRQVRINAAAIEVGGELHLQAALF